MKDDFEDKNDGKNCNLDCEDYSNNGKNCGQNDKKKCCSDMDSLKKELESLRNEYATTKDKLYQYSAHISKLQSMLDRVPSEIQKQKLQFCSNTIALYNNLVLIKGSDDYLKASDEMKSLFDFFQKEVLRVLNEYGVSVIYPTKGEECNYDICSAESVVEGDKSNTIVAVHSPAFKMGDMCIARARVTVSKVK
jgi:molecular chaperone GrpE (heat shock protein)